MKDRNVVPLVAPLVASVAVFAYLRFVGDDTLAARLGLYVTVGLGAVVGLVIGRRLVRES